jgi:tRNA A-37 threonylcarbamoyl transferase component Bud32
MNWQLTAEIAEVLVDGTLPLRAWLEAGTAKIAKAGPHRVVYRATLGDKAVYIKQYLTNDRASKLRTLVAGPKAARELAVLRAMHKAGLPVPRALGLGMPAGRSKPPEKSAPSTAGSSAGTGLNLPFLDDATSSYLILEAIEPTMSLANLMTRFAEVMQRDLLGIRGRQHLAVACGRMVAQLHRAGFVHRDLQAENLLVAPVQTHGPMRLWWVDLSDIRQRWLGLSQSEIMENLAMFRHSLHRQLSRTDQLRFLAAYLEELAGSSSRASTVGTAANAFPTDPSATSDAVDFMTRPRRHPLGQLPVPTQRKSSPTAMKAFVQRLIKASRDYSITAWKRADRKWRRGNRRLFIVQHGKRSGRCVAGMDPNLLRQLVDGPSQLFSPPFLVQSTEGAALQKGAIIQLPISSGVMRAELVARPLVPDGRDSWARRMWENSYAMMRRGFSTPGPLMIIETEREQLVARAFHHEQQTVGEWIHEQGRLSFQPGSPEMQLAERLIITVSKLLESGFHPEVADLDQFFVLKLNNRFHVAVADPSRFAHRERITPKEMAASFRELHDSAIRMTSLRTSTCARWLKRIAKTHAPATWQSLMVEILKQRAQRVENYKKWHAA